MKRRQPPAATQKVVLALTPEEQQEINEILSDVAAWTGRWLRRTVMEYVKNRAGGTCAAGRPN